MKTEQNLICTMLFMLLAPVCIYALGARDLSQPMKTSLLGEFSAGLSHVHQMCMRVWERDAWQYGSSIHYAW